MPEEDWVGLFRIDNAAQFIYSDNYDGSKKAAHS